MMHTLLKECEKFIQSFVNISPWASIRNTFYNNHTIILKLGDALNKKSDFKFSGPFGNKEGSQEVHIKFCKYHPWACIHKTS